MTAALPAAGCSAGQPATSQATVASCYAFAVQALNQHVTVTSVPPACTGLTHEQINLAADRAIRAVVGPHRKVVARRLAHEEAAYLSYLVTVVPPHAPAPPAASPATPSQPPAAGSCRAGRLGGHRGGRHLAAGGLDRSRRAAPPLCPGGRGAAGSHRRSLHARPHRAGHLDRFPGHRHGSPGLGGRGRGPVGGRARHGHPGRWPARAAPARRRPARAAVGHSGSAGPRSTGHQISQRRTAARRGCPRSKFLPGSR